MEVMRCGDLLRAEVRAGTALGALADGYIASGSLVPDEVASAVVLPALRRLAPSPLGWLLVGFPRTRAQAEALTTDAATRPDCCLSLSGLGDDDLAARRMGRRIDPRTGKTFHLTLDPPPKGDFDLMARLVALPGDRQLEGEGVGAKEQQSRAAAWCGSGGAAGAALRHFEGLGLLASLHGGKPKAAVFADACAALDRCRGRKLSPSGSGPVFWVKLAGGSLAKKRAKNLQRAALQGPSGPPGRAENASRVSFDESGGAWGGRRQGGRRQASASTKASSTPDGKPSPVNNPLANRFTDVETKEEPAPGISGGSGGVGEHKSSQEYEEREELNSAFALLPLPPMTERRQLSSLQSSLSSNTSSTSSSSLSSSSSSALSSEGVEVREAAGPSTAAADSESSQNRLGAGSVAAKGGLGASSVGEAERLRSENTRRQSALLTKQLGELKEAMEGPASSLGDREAQSSAPGGDGAVARGRPIRPPGVQSRR